MRGLLLTLPLSALHLVALRSKSKWYDEKTQLYNCSAFVPIFSFHFPLSRASFLARQIHCERIVEKHDSGYGRKYFDYLIHSVFAWRTWLNLEMSWTVTVYHWKHFSKAIERSSLIWRENHMMWGMNIKVLSERKSGKKINSVRKTLSTVFGGKYGNRWIECKPFSASIRSHRDVGFRIDPHS